MPNLVIEAPKVYAPLHNLLSKAKTPVDGAEVWENGIEMVPTGCHVIHGQCNVLCPPSQKSESQGCIDPVTFKPYLIEFGFEWPGRERANLEEIASNLILAGSSSVLEDMVWNGCGDDNVNPTFAEADPVVATSLSVKDAFGAIVSELVSSENHIGARGTIHMSPFIASYLDGQIAGDENGDLYTVFGGHAVIIGNYPNDAIAAHIGDVNVFVSDPFVTESFDEVRTRNILNVRVERVALVSWNACATFRQPVTSPIGS